jgi:hypothetical protein
VSFAEYEFKVRAVLASGQMGLFSAGARAVPGLFQSPHDFRLAFTVGLFCSRLTKDFIILIALFQFFLHFFVVFLVIVFCIIKLLFNCLFLQ